MALSVEVISDPVGWNDIFREAAEKYQLQVHIGTADFSNSVSFLKEKLVMFTIGDNAVPGTELLSYKNRVRGFLKVLADTCPKIAELFKVDCYVASSDGNKRDAVIRRTLRPATEEERATLGVAFVSEHEPLSTEELWEEWQSCTAKAKRVIIAFRDR